MPVSVKVGGAWKTSTATWVKINGVWRKAAKVYVKAGGNWEEGWPLAPNPPQSPNITQAYSGDNIVITANWSAPAAGGAVVTKYQVRFVFTNIETGVQLIGGWTDRTPAQLSLTSDNAGNGWQHRSATNRVVCQVIAYSATDNSATVTSPAVVVMQMPAPPAPTSFDVNIVACDLSETWAHVGGNRLDKFEIQTWIGSDSPTTYTLGPTVRSFSGQPWNPATVGRQYTYSRIRAVGQGGASAWVTVSGIMPGPVAFNDVRFEGGTMKANIYYGYEGFLLYTQKNPNTAVLQATYTDTVASPVAVSYSGSSAFARDNSSLYRFIVTPRNSANGWTGRAQGSTWCIKIPNPVYIQPGDCNTWWSQPIPGKWRDNPQADDWFYQGKSISGNSCGTLFYQSQVVNYFSSSRLGYKPGVTSWDVYVKRTYTGGLVAAVNLGTWLHRTVDDSVNALPGMILGPQTGPALARSQQAWVDMPISWWDEMASGAARGVNFFVDPNAADNQLRSEIGNVSNRYMILDKPHYGAHLDGQPPGTLRIYHDG